MDHTCFLEVREDVVDGFEGIVGALCCATTTEEFVAVGVFDEGVDSLFKFSGLC